MEYINIIWKISTLLYTVFSLVEGQGPFGHKSPVLFDSGTTTEVTVKEGEEAVLPCEGTNMEDSTVTWLKDGVSTILAAGGDLSITDGRFSISRTSTGQEYLKIANTRLNDTDHMACMLDSFPPMLKHFQLLIQAPPKIDKLNMIQTYKFTQGETVRLKCKVQGSPKPTVNWFFYKSNSGQKQERELVSMNENLILKNLSAADGGIYRCEAHNDLGEDMYEIFFQEVYKPKLYTSNRRTTAKIGESAILQCEVESNPPPVIRWQRDNTLITDSWKYSIKNYLESVNKKISVLDIMTTSHIDSGLYICIAENEKGRDNIKLFLTVEDTSTNEATSLQVISTTLETTVKYNEPTTEVIVTKIQPDNLLKTTKASTTPSEKLESPRTEASSNIGVKTYGNFIIAVLLSIMCVTKYHFL